MALIAPYSATLHTGYAIFQTYDGAAWCYIGGTGLLEGRIFYGDIAGSFFRCFGTACWVIAKRVSHGRAERPFTIDAIVILPDHLHAVWTLPDGDADYSGRWRAIKSKFTHELRLSGMPLTPDKRGEYRLWQRQFWEHTIRDDSDFQGMSIISAGIRSSMG
ncbi:MAG TPA: hypothetical protein VIF10_00250 [Methylobacter sp.]